VAHKSDSSQLKDGKGGEQQFGENHCAIVGCSRAPNGKEVSFVGPNT
jgi:hypothetical protein